MSVWAQSWAYEQRAGSGGSKAVLVALAVFADEDGFCYPSQERIAGMTEQGVRTVRLHLAALEAAGLIRRERRRRPDGTYLSDGFSLLAPAKRLRPHIPAPEEVLRQILPAADSAGCYPAADIAAGEGNENAAIQGNHPAANPAVGKSCRRQKTAQPAADSAKSSEIPPIPPYKEVLINEPSVEPSVSARTRASPVRRATPIPDTFEVTQAMVDWAEGEGISFELMQRESKKFVNYYTANGKTMKVWRKAWENWLLRAQESIGKRNWA